MDGYRRSPPIASGWPGRGDRTRGSLATRGESRSPPGGRSPAHLSASELPDFLPLFLEFLATLPAQEACATLGQPAHILAALAERLRKRGSPYEAAFRALAALAVAKPKAEDILQAFAAFRSLPQERELPSAPKRPVQYMEQQDRPQPRKDVERERGMAAFVGRLRPCPVLDWKFVALGHNTVRGAAGAAVLNAELMYSEGLLD